MLPDWAIHYAKENATCVRRQVGAAIYNRGGKFLSMGWNRAEDLSLTCDTDCPRAHSGVPSYADSPALDGHYKEGAGRCIAIHAEDMALRKTTPEERRGGVLYTSEVPCADCVDLLMDSGLARWEVKK